MTTQVNADVLGAITSLSPTTLTMSGLASLLTTTTIASTKTGATGTVAHDFSTSAVWFHTGVIANFTLNLTNVPTTNNRIMQVAVVITQGGTGFYPNAFMIDGIAQTINWYGVTPVPTSTLNAVDVVTFTLYRSSSAWRVQGDYKSSIAQLGSKTTIASLGVGTSLTQASTLAAGEIRATNEVTAYYSSDETLKENIVPIENALIKLRQITGVMFDWTDEAIAARGGEDGFFVRKHDTGIIAQKVEPVLPEVVARRDDGKLAVKYEKLAGLIIQAINELADQVDELKIKIK